MADTAIDPELTKAFMALPITALSRNEFNIRNDILRGDPPRISDAKIVRAAIVRLAPGEDD
jgi:hypothetical protein